MADPTIFEWQLQDDQGLTNRTSLYVAYNGATLTVDEMIAAWVGYGALIDPCIDAAIQKGRITIPLNPDAGWKATPVDGNNVNQIMTVNFENDFNSYLTPFLLPSYKETQLDANNKPNLAAAALAALVTRILDGYAAVTPEVFPNSRDIHDLNAVREAFLTTRKVRQNKARTLVVP